jgi:hypothetical protein
MPTARPFAYNTGEPISGTTQVGDLAIGTPSNPNGETPPFWNGPNEDLGYVIAIPVSGNTQPTPVLGNNIYLSPTYKGIDINLSNNNQTAYQQFGYQQSVLGTNAIGTGDKVMFSVLVSLAQPATLPDSHVIGIGYTDMNYQGNPYGGYPGNDSESFGYGSDGNIYYEGNVSASGFQTWTTGDIIDVVVDSSVNKMWVRVNGGDWDNNPSDNPVTNTGGFGIFGGPFYPVLCPAYEGTMTIQNYPTYGVPSGYLFLGNVFASVGFFRTKTFSDNEFINLSQFVSGKFNDPQTFASATDASTWLTTNGFWNSYTGILVPTDGLTLYVDAGVNLSYSGSGNQWYDLSGNNNTGTLQNSPTYSSSDGGVLTFNGSNQYISFSSPTNIPIGNSNYTISVWFNTNTLGGNGFVGWGNWGSGNQVNAFRLGGSNLLNYWWGNDLAAAASISINTWYNAVARFDGTNRQIWVNNVMVGQDTPGSGHNVPNANNLRIGSTNNGEYFNGKISNVEIYDRALSDSEIAAIWDNLKSRFGL